jgi:putative acetyltransferase
MTPVSLRPATPDDADALSALIRDCVRTSNAADYDAATIDAICANFTPEKVLEKMAVRDVFAALAGDRLVGTVSLGNVSAGSGKLHSLFVAPQHQRAGIGRMLTLNLERHALGRGLRELRLSSSLTARPFYARLGWRALDFEPRPDGATWLMVKSLSD